MDPYWKETYCEYVGETKTKQYCVLAGSFSAISAGISWHREKAKVLGWIFWQDARETYELDLESSSDADEALARVRRWAEDRLDLPVCVTVSLVGGGYRR